jgi:hypothetical protein
MKSLMSDLLLWVLGGLGTILSAVSGLVTKNRRDITRLKEETKMDQDDTRLDEHEERLKQQEQLAARMERYFVGDEDDPLDKGALREIHEIRKILEDEHGYNIDQSIDDDD